MLKINYEYRKGIFFIRIFGNFNKNNYLKNNEQIKEILQTNKFKYIVINTNYLNEIDMAGLNYLLEICYIAKENEGNLILCDKTNNITRLFNYNIPNISDEIEVL